MPPELLALRPEDFGIPTRPDLRVLHGNGCTGWSTDSISATLLPAAMLLVDGWFPAWTQMIMHPCVGVNTEAAEQAFHIAGRWPLVLSYAAPTHQEILLPHL